MNKLDLDYQNLLKDILENGVKKETRNGGTISVFGRQIRHNMKDGFPLLTTKKMPFKTIVTELLWFLQGDTNIKYLVDNGCNIWNGDCYKSYKQSILESFDRLSKDPVIDAMPPRILSQEEFINKIKTDDEFAKKWGSLGKIYGYQWRNWVRSVDYDIDYENGINDEIDQIQNLINDLKTNPDSRRLMVNAWNVGELDQMVLPPCHYGFQVYTRELSSEEIYELADEKRWKLVYDESNNDKVGTTDDIIKKYNIPKRTISLMWNQRSVDTFLGLPFNIASYGLLLEIIAKQVNMVPEELIGNLGDVHLYSNHLDAAKEQIGRELTTKEMCDLAGVDYDEATQWTYHGKTIDRDLEVRNILSDKDVKNIPKRTREPFPLPTVTLPSGLIPNENNWDKLVFEDFYLNDYQSHSTIKAPLSN